MMNLIYGLFRVILKMLETCFAKNHEKLLHQKVLSYLLNSYFIFSNMSILLILTNNKWTKTPLIYTRYDLSSVAQVLITGHWSATYGGLPSDSDNLTLFQSEWILSWTVSRLFQQIASIKIIEHWIRKIVS